MIQNRFLLASLAVVCVLGTSACAPREQVRGGSVPFGEVADIERMPQNLEAYAKRAGAERKLLSDGAQAEQNTRFNRLFFSPWDAVKASVSPADAFSLLGVKGESRARGYAENLLPWTQAAWNALVVNADREHYPSRLDRAITVRPTPLREAPTARPRFADPTKAGEGFPFDYFMYATLPTGMPLLVTHTSADGAWFFVENALVGGWVPSKDVALTDEAFRTRYRNGRYAAILRDDVSLRDEAGRYVTTAHIGAVLPVERKTNSGLVLLTPGRDALGRGVLFSTPTSREDAAEKPLPLTPGALAGLGNRMMGQAYGWGGMYENRDCSSMTRDLFTPFGVWLPRNSSAQAKAWDYVDFSAQSEAAKERMIVSEGTPFATLLWLRGHIGLYVGEYEGKPAMFHNMWGLRTEKGGLNGRFVIGRAVVTGLKPGAELPDIVPQSLLLPRMQGMSVLR